MSAKSYKYLNVRIIANSPQTVKQGLGGFLKPCNYKLLPLQRMV